MWFIGLYLTKRLNEVAEVPTAKTDPLDQVFMALADQTRRSLVHRLAQGEMTMSQLAEGFDMSLAAISKHVKVLEVAKLVKRRKEGRIHYIQLVPEQLTGALDWISVYRYFWQQRMESLSDFIENDSSN